MNNTAQLALDPKLSTGPPLKTALKIVSRSTETRASNEARAWLVVADVTPTGYRVGKFLASHARYATAADVRRHVVPGELFTYWPQAKIAAEMGCSERQVRRGVRSMREAGALEVRRRVRPCEASYVWVLPVRSESACVRSGVLSGVRSHTEPRTEPQKNHEGSSSCARVVCPKCRHDWLAEDRDGRSYGTKCHRCGHDPSTGTPADDKPKADVPACTCGDAYRNSYGRRCVDCEGEPSAAQRDALREKHGGGGAHEGGVQMGGGLTTTQGRRQTNARRRLTLHSLRVRHVHRLTAASRARPKTHRSVGASKLTLPSGLSGNGPRRNTAQTGGGWHERHEKNWRTWTKGEQADDRP